MTIKELANELNILIESGYGDAKAVIGIPTVYVTEDRDMCKEHGLQPKKFDMNFSYDID